MSISTSIKTVLLVASMAVFSGTVLSGASVAHAEPQPVPYVFLYDLGVAGTDDAIRAETALHEFTRKANTEGWVLQTEALPYIKHFKIYKAKGTSIENLVVNRLKGCESFDANCKRYVRNLNRRKVDDVAQLDAYEGEVLLPAQALRYKVSVDAKNHYMEESVAVPGQTQLKVVAIITSEFHLALAPLRQQIVSSWSSFCNGDGCIELYELKVK